ncbi:MAG: replication-associated recombination protein A [Erysipelotrichales bacterium]|nr:replication-associated recombination protein A [Erysipelotrichales bacterium]
MKAPLAFRMRPKTLDEVLGQKDLLSEDGFLTRCVKTDTVVSMIFFGPPGVGKTTMAEAFANSIKAHSIKLNAVTSNKKDLEEAINECKMYERAIIIMDEIHRLNKDKQDILLPYLEDGTIFVVGATTANPYISINPAIRSRCHLLEVKPLNKEDVALGIKRAIEAKNGLNNSIKVNEDAIYLLASMSGGDMRFALNYLEILSLSYKNKELDIEDIKEIVKVPNYLVDRDENGHYDAVSALQKSIRGSDVDAALYYLARLCVANDLDSIERRLLVTAYEDIGLANPAAVDRTFNAIEAAKKVGFPEAIIPLGFAVCDLALSPKSKVSNNAVHAAYDLAKNTPLDVMDYLKLTPVNKDEEDLYPYDRPDLWEKIQYLPNLIKNEKFYEPVGTSRYEMALNENYKRLHKTKRSNNLRELKKLK